MVIDVIGEFDRLLLGIVAGWRNGLADSFFLAVTWLGSLWFLLPVSAVAGLFRWPSPRAALLLLAALLAASAASHLLKVASERARPALYEAIAGLPGDASFPSSHSAQAAAFATMLALLLPPEARVPALPVLAVAVLLVGASRLYLQVHWPSDVLAGWLLGALVAALIWINLGREGGR